MRRINFQHLIDPEFYSSEANLTRHSLSEMADHFAHIGQFNGLNPSSVFLWSWCSPRLKVTNPSIKQFIDVGGSCLHPIFSPSALSKMLVDFDEDFMQFYQFLIRMDKEDAPIHSLIKRMTLTSKEQSLNHFMNKLSCSSAKAGNIDFDLFSSSWYLDTYDDVKTADDNLFQHYFERGWTELRDPSPEFSTKAYLSDHPDVAEKGENPLFHYLSYGSIEGRSVQVTTNVAGHVRHRTLRGTGPSKYVSFEPLHARELIEVSTNFGHSKLVIVIPFYKNAHLVESVLSSVYNQKAQILESKALLVIVNDSPDDASLKKKIELWLEKAKLLSLDVIYIANKNNMGFVYSSNLGMFLARQTNCDCLLLNSDAKISQGLIREMTRVLHQDDKFGFCNPRSNNATIATIASSPSQDWMAIQLKFDRLKDRLPDYRIVPVVVGFCLLIRKEVLKLHGFLDSAYGLGYNEENDYIMRANRSGFVCVLCNRAYAAHIGEQSFKFNEKDTTQGKNRNEILLAKRYPEYFPAVKRYFTSNEYNASLLVEGDRDADEILIDVSDVPKFVNGTSKLARSLIPSLVSALGPDRCTILGEESQFDVIFAERPAGLKYIESSSEKRFQIGIRLSQPYQKSAISTLSRRATRIGIAMLDTISQDCLYLQDTSTALLWNWVASYSDLLVYNSEYTKNKFVNRYDVTEDCVHVSSFHSLSQDEYTWNGSLDPSLVRLAPAKDFVLLVGNHFEHKAVFYVAQILKNANVKFVVIGIELPDKEILSFGGGKVDDETFYCLRTLAYAVIFPSTYEGFGFPIMEALAAKTSVLVYDCPLTRDIWARIGYPNKVHFFSAFDEIVSKLQDAKESKFTDLAVSQKHDDGWRRSSIEIAGAIENVLLKDANYSRILSRMRHMAASVL